MGLCLSWLPLPLKIVSVRLTTCRRSSLSHNFYQLLVGKSDAGLYHLKQLIVWSIEHSCLSGAEKAGMLEQWKARWQEFLLWVIENYGKTKVKREESIL